ncbi:MAG: SDR family oxidoreductase [Burkholderiales bacterium]
MRRIVITGASAGLGAALAQHFAGPDTVLLLIARRAEPLQALASSLPGRCEFHALDVTDHAALGRAAQEFCDRHGAPDLVIANAGISVGTRGEDTADVAKLQRVLAVNVVGLAATLAAFAPAMRAARSGTLCGIASVAAFRGLPGAGAYSASKSAAIKWLEALRVELAGTGVAVVTVCPGYIDTPMTRVNRYRMPFLLPADEAARRIARAIRARRRLAVIPWQMALVSYVLRALPDWLYDRFAARAPRKPRDLPL